MKVKPATPGAIVRDPHTKRPVPDEGEDVPDTSYWIRRLRDGDVVLVEGPELSAPAELEDRMVRNAPKRKSEDR
jgi:hypothetical protein